MDILVYVVMLTLFLGNNGRTDSHEPDYDYGLSDYDGEGKYISIIFKIWHAKGFANLPIILQYNFNFTCYVESTDEILSRLLKEHEMRITYKLLTEKFVGDDSDLDESEDSSGQSLPKNTFGQIQVIFYLCNCKIYTKIYE